MDSSCSEATEDLSALTSINELEGKQTGQFFSYEIEERLETGSLLENTPDSIIMEPTLSYLSERSLIEYIFTENSFTLYQQSGFPISEALFHLSTLYNEFTLKMEDELKHTEEGVCMKLNLTESTLKPWFNLIQGLEQSYDSIDRNTLFMALIGQDHTIKEPIEPIIPSSKPLKLCGITDLILNVFNLDLPKENINLIQHKNYLIKILGMSSKTLDHWFSYLRLILKINPAADVNSFFKLLISQTAAARTRCYISISQPEPRSLWDKYYQESARVLAPTKKLKSKDDLEFNILQTFTCLSRLDYEDRCCACIAKKSDMCRFKYLRLFSKVNMNYINRHHFLTVEMAEDFLAEIKLTIRKVTKKRISEKSRLYLEAFKIPELKLAPSQICDYDKVDRSQYASYTMGFLAPAFLPILDREVAHIFSKNHTLYYRKPTAPIGQTCDSCNTNIFSAFWICIDCGREMCLDCHSNWDSEKLVHRNFLENCKGTSLHNSSDFIPVTNYFPSTIKALYDSVSAYVEANPSGPEKLPPICPESLYTPECYPSLPYPYMEPEEFTIDHFRSCWQNGQPAVLKGSRITPKYPVTPCHFTEHYGNVKTEILRPDGDGFSLMEIKDFFSEFDNPEKGNQDMKIKDWPSEGSYQECFPHLNQDFMNMLPFPEYMSYSGPLNLVSMLPSHSHTIPDLGPKTYIAYAGSQGEVVGTTQLHLDAADAINVLQYSGGNPDEPGAIWDLFRREDTELIRQFILKKYSSIFDIADPIHDQVFYLSDKLLEELYLTNNVRSFRVYQRVGEVVLIPAGCPHQVRNLHPCIKTAMDFVAPEGLAMCTKLAAEFRRLSRRHKRGVDIVGTSTLLAQAWGTCLKWSGTSSPFLDEHIVIPSSVDKRHTNSDVFIPTTKKPKV